MGPRGPAGSTEVALSRERAVDLSHRMLESLLKSPAVELTAEREFVRNRILAALLDWDKEHERLVSGARRRILARGRKVAEGSREWELLLAEEMHRAYADLIGRGE